MLQDFGPRLIHHILFLRSVATVTLSVWRDNEPQPHVLHCVRMGGDGCDFRTRCTVCCCCCRRCRRCCCRRCCAAAAAFLPAAAPVSTLCRCADATRAHHADNWQGPALLMSSRLTVFVTHGVHGEAAAAPELEAGGGAGSSRVGGRQSLPDLLRRKSIAAAAVVEGARPGEVAFEFLVVYGCGGEW
jgi:hypothetical protein